MTGEPAYSVVSCETIELGTRLRSVDPQHVDALVASIVDVGLLNPITVYPRKLYQGGNWIDGYGVIAGAHRLAACAKIGLTSVPVVILDMPDLERQIAECDENLCAPKLSPSDRARFTRRRKEAYEALHPETKHGTNQHTRGVAKLATPTFAEDQAKATGASERVVQRDAERAEKVIDEVLDLLKGTPLDTGAYLDRLKKLPGNEQFKAAKRDLAFERTKERNNSVRDSLPQSIKDMEAAKAGRSKRPGPAVNPEVRLAELEEENAALKDDNARLKAQVDVFDAMRVQWEEGGFDKVVAGKDEEIRTLKTRVERESGDKVKWKRKADFFKAEAERRGYSKDTVIPLNDGAGNG